MMFYCWFWFFGGLSKSHY